MLLTSVSSAGTRLGGTYAGGPPHFFPTVAPYEQVSDINHPWVEALRIPNGMGRWPTCFRMDRIDRMTRFPWRECFQKAKLTMSISDSF